MTKKPVKVLFVCLGNICRSPTAHALFQAHVNKHKLNNKIIVDSAGTGDWHIGRAPDQRAQKTALDNGYDMSHLRARQVSTEDFFEFDYVLAMDHENLTNLEVMKPNDYQGVLGLFLQESGMENNAAVPDPYYGGEEHFNSVIEMIQQAVDGLLQRVCADHQL